MLEDIDTHSLSCTFFLHQHGRTIFSNIADRIININPNSIHIYFPVKIKKKANEAADIDGHLITINNFLLILSKKSV